MILLNFLNQISVEFYIESSRKNALSQVYCCVANIWNTLNFYEKVKMFLKLWLKCSIPVQISNPNQARYNLKMSSPSWVCFNLTLWRLKNNVIINGKFISSSKQWTWFLKKLYGFVLLLTLYSFLPLIDKKRKLVSKIIRHL